MFQTGKCTKLISQFEKWNCLTLPWLLPEYQPFFFWFRCLKFTRKNNKKQYHNSKIYTNHHVGQNQLEKFLEKKTWKKSLIFLIFSTFPWFRVGWPNHQTVTFTKYTFLDKYILDNHFPNGHFTDYIDSLYTTSSQKYADNNDNIFVVSLIERLR